LPDDGGHEILSTEYLIAQDLEVVGFVVVDSYPQGAVLREKATDDFETVAHE
jgi:hypothetical protein